MNDLIELMAAPFVACVVLVGIHAYLGMHVIQRKVIFVDLALAQIAALGATCAFLLGVSPHGKLAYLFALGFAIAGAAIFSLTRMRHERIPQEAIIGIVYAVALATAILVADRAPEGAEHIKESLVGAVLWVSWPTIFKTAIIYGLVGAVHIAFRERFIQISFRPEEAYAEGRNVRLWDFIFYVSFAFVITSSVAIAGVLMVFTFLVIPAVIATLFATRIWTRLALGWTVGITASLFGMLASYRFDMPSGPTVVASLGLTLVAAGCLYYVLHESRRVNAIAKVSAAALIAVGSIAALNLLTSDTSFLQIEHEHDWEDREHEAEHDGSGDWTEISASCNGDAACMATRFQGSGEAWTHLTDRLSSTDPAERDSVIRILNELRNEPAMDLLASAAAVETDPLLGLDEVRILIEEGDGRGPGLAVGLLDGDVPPLVREEAHALLLETSGEDFGYDAFADQEANGAALTAWRRWAGGEGAGGGG